MMEVQDQREMIANNQELEAELPKTGNMLIFCNKFSLGPDYIFFIPAFLSLTFICFMMLYFVWTSSSNYGFIASSLVFAFLTPTSYFLTAFTNPGIYDPYSNIEQKYKYCEECKFFIPRKVSHCYKCNICIEGLDHHCPWMSKCVGKGNLYYFYTFIFSMPITIIYSWIALIFCFQKQ